MQKKNEYIFYEKHLEFKSYNFCFSSLHKNPIIPSSRINSICLHTFPQSLIIDAKEVIFLNHKEDSMLSEFATKNNIPISNHIDTWGILTRSFLDSESDSLVISEQNKQLLSVGISENKIAEIENKIKLIFIGTMEYSYLGLWDLLALKQERNPFYCFFGKKFYWWAMEIALKGISFKKS